MLLTLWRFEIEHPVDAYGKPNIVQQTPLTPWADPVGVNITLGV